MLKYVYNEFKVVNDLESKISKILSQGLPDIDEEKIWKTFNERLAKKKNIEEVFIMNQLITKFKKVYKDYGNMKDEMVTLKKDISNLSQQV
jgi:hypothetical protein